MSRAWLQRFLLMLYGALLFAVLPVRGAQVIARLEAGDKVYTQVRVKQVLPDAIIIVHSDGLAKVPMADLPESWQQQLGYDPEQAETYREQLAQREQAVRDRQAREAAKDTREKAATKPRLAAVMAKRMQQPPELRERVDLRPEFRRMGFYAKNQGRRPSCAVFSVVSALEYQLGRSSGKPARLSEEYLIWATRQSLGLEQTRIEAGETLAGDADLGFTLGQVVQAVRAYGVADAGELPNTFGKQAAEIAAPSDATIERARNRRQVEASFVRGESPEVQLDGVVHLLNAGVPAVIGLAWPHYAAVSRSPLIDGQTPREGAGHAVTLVGYKCESGQREDTLFLFKNSWGPRWGNGGYGWVSWDYLRDNLQSAVFFDSE